MVFYNSSTGQMMLYTGVKWIPFASTMTMSLEGLFIFRDQDWEYIVAQRRRKRIFILVPLAILFIVIGEFTMKTNIAITLCLFLSAAFSVAGALI